jgi:hypothetical protein
LKRGPYSFSKFSDYETCPHRYRLLHLDRHQPVRPAASQKLLDIGDVGHAFAEQYLAHLGKAGVSRDTTHAARLANWVFSDRPTNSLVEDDRTMFVSLAMVFARTIDWAPVGEVFLELPLAIDANFRIVDFEDPTRMIGARIDALVIDGEDARIIDWKFGWGRETESFFQLLIYALLVSLYAPGVQRFLMTCHHVRHNQPDEVRARRPLDRVQRRIGDVIARIEGDQVFEARPSASACSMCPVAYCCEAKPSELVEIRTDDDARTVAMDIILLDNMRAQKLAALRPYCEASGSVSVPGGEFAIHPTERLEFDTWTRAEEPRTAECPRCNLAIEIGPPERLIDQIIRLGGEDPDKLYKIDPRRAREILESDTPAGKLLEKLAQRKMGTRFTVQKPKKPE